ncbi:SEC-C metal-binding domain-containing protein [Agaribacter flavus]|uniref:SEC-C metal-binding domain-containing protein n=1 Tax=Agaribacter flavus TaxID=1902781 RepID=A0ABV7FKR3_9ALTE
MRGVELVDWPELPENMELELEAIALHGLEENFEVLESLSLQEHQELAQEISPAAVALHRYFLAQRTPNFMNPKKKTVTNRPKVGRNEPCPCGSGKKFKKCCLH